MNFPGSEDVTRHRHELIADLVVARKRIFDLERALEDAAAAEREACAKLCDDQRDLREEARATLRASEELKSGDEDSMLRALRHEGNVRIYHSGIEKCAAAIRARSKDAK